MSARYRNVGPTNTSVNNGRFWLANAIATFSAVPWTELQLTRMIGQPGAVVDRAHRGDISVRWVRAGWARQASLSEVGVDGKRVLVVGASSGVGAAVARMAVEQGARVAISARRAQALEAMAEVAPQMIALPADVRDARAAREVVDDAVAALGGLDAVVYSVGVSPLVPLADATQQQWRDVLDTNVVGAAMVSAAAAPHLLESDGRLILLSSKSVRWPFPHLTLYATSKFALDGLIRCLPGEFPGLRVTRVVVGNTAGTDFTSSWDPEALDAAIGRWSASGVLGGEAGDTMDPEDVADTILHVITAAGQIDDVAVIDHL